MKVKTSKGFTLAELLIVMAIIVVLAAVAIPTFSRQLETARESSDLELIRNAYTEALSYAMLDVADGTLDGKKGADSSSAVDLLASNDAKFKYASSAYKVKLESPTTQSKKTFDYVNATIAGKTVGDTSQTLKAEYDDMAIFTFALTNGVLTLSSITTDKWS